MDRHPTLRERVERYSRADPLRQAVAITIQTLAAASIDIADLISQGALAGITGQGRGRNTDGDIQKDLDVRAHEIIHDALELAPVAALASEEAAGVELWDPNAPICVAIDPLDGSSNVGMNMSVGTIFSIVSTPPDLEEAFTRSAAAQLAAGFFIYGPQTTLTLTFGDGVDIFALDRRDGTFKLVRSGVQIPSDTAEYAINASNQRHWDEAIRIYINDCLAGASRPLGVDFNMRWIGSMVAEAYRILMRGGIYLYPADARPGYEEGCLRLVYEAHPIAFLIEQAGGRASTGEARILDLAATTLHQRVPLIMGSAERVRLVERLHQSPDIVSADSAPLFAHRGFFRV